ESARRRQVWIAATRDITTEFLAGTDSAEVLTHLVEQVRRLTGSTCAFLAEPLDPETPAHEVALLRITRSDGPCEELVGHTLSIPGTPLASAFHSHSPYRFPTTDAAGLVEELAESGPVLLQPLHTTESTLGLLAAARGPEEPPYDDETLELTTAFAGQVALAMQLAAAQQQMRELGVLTDRDRIARDLHDHVIQRLFAIGMALQGTIPRSRRPEVRERISDAVDQL
ncbi:GAF domain-containing protein, partial [Nocardia gipuzkoensis]